MRLIDILNKIANGELKEGTKVKRKDVEGWGELEYTYTNGDLERKCCDETIYFYEEIFARHLNEEVELIEPNHSPDVGKMAEPTDNTKIEELEAMGETKFEYGEPVPADWVMANKINEVIRYINK